jgi:hypothetical protein
MSLLHHEITRIEFHLRFRSEDHLFRDELISIDLIGLSHEAANDILLLLCTQELVRNDPLDVDIEDIATVIIEENGRKMKIFLLDDMVTESIEQQVA